MPVFIIRPSNLKPGKTDDITTIQRMVAEDWNNLLRKANEVLA